MIGQFVPEEIEGLEMEPAPEPVFFWALDDNRRIVVAEWGQLKVLGQRVFRRFVGGKGRWIDLQATLHKLSDPGRPAAAVLGNHVLGFVRPWQPINQRIAPGSAPAMIARRSKRGFPLVSPVLMPGVEEGRTFLRDLRDQRAISPAEWRCYEGECPSEPVEKLFMSGSQGLRTQLEHDLVETFGPAGRARQAFTLPAAAAS